MIDWAGCHLVVRREGCLGGGPALRDDPRVMPEAVYENMDDGMTAEQVVEARCPLRQRSTSEYHRARDDA